MRGKRTMKRILAMVMAVVFTVCGITFTPKTANAATWTADPNHTGYIYWYGADGEAGWGMATWGSGGWNYSYDYTHGGTESLFAAQNESSDNQTIQLGSPKATYDANTEYYYRYVIHSDVAFNSVAYLIGYYADWGETGLGSISFNAGDTVISGTKTTGNAVTSIAVALKLANVPKGTTISVDEYYFGKTPYVTTSAGPTTTAEPTTAEPTTADEWIPDTNHDGWIRWNGPDGVNDWGMGSWSALGEYFKYRYDYAQDSLFAIKNCTGSTADVWIASPKANYQADTQYYYRYVLHSTATFTGNVYVQGYSTGWGEQTHASQSYTAGGDTIISGTTTTNSNQITSIAISLKLLGVPANAEISVKEAYIDTVPYGETTVAPTTTTAEPTTASPWVDLYEETGNQKAFGNWTAQTGNEGGNVYFYHENSSTFANLQLKKTSAAAELAPAGKDYSYYKLFITNQDLYGGQDLVDGATYNLQFTFNPSATGTLYYYQGGEGSRFSYWQSETISSTGSQIIDIPFTYDASVDPSDSGNYFTVYFDNFPANTTFTGFDVDFERTYSTSPLNPEDITAQRANDDETEVTLSWGNNVNMNASQVYNIYNSSGTKIGTTSAGATSYTIPTAVAAGTTPTYTVKGELSSTESSGVTVDTPVFTTAPTADKGAWQSVGSNGYQYYIHSAGEGGYSTAYTVSGTTYPFAIQNRLYTDGEADNYRVGKQITGMHAYSTYHITATCYVDAGTPTVYANYQLGSGSAVGFGSQASASEGEYTFETDITTSSTDNLRVFFTGAWLGSEGANYDGTLAVKSIAVEETWSDVYAETDNTKTYDFDNDGTNDFGAHSPNAGQLSYKVLSASDERDLSKLAFQRTADTSGEGQLGYFYADFLNEYLLENKYSASMAGDYYNVSIQFTSNQADAGKVGLYYGKDGWGYASGTLNSVSSGVNTVTSATPVRLDNNLMSKTDDFLRLQLGNLSSGTIISNISCTFTRVDPINVASEDLVLTNPSDNTIGVAWAHPSGYNTNQRYNIYLDGTLTHSNVDGTTDTLTGVTAGEEHTVTVKSVLGTQESSGTSKTITLSGWIPVRDTDVDLTNWTLHANPAGLSYKGGSSTTIDLKSTAGGDGEYGMWYNKVTRKVSGTGVDNIYSSCVVGKRYNLVVSATSNQATANFYVNQPYGAGSNSYSLTAGSNTLRIPFTYSSSVGANGVELGLGFITTGTELTSVSISVEPVADLTFSTTSSTVSWTETANHTYSITFTRGGLPVTMSAVSSPYTFNGTTGYPDEGTTITVNDTTTSGREYEVALGTALPNLKVSSVTVSNPSDTVYRVGDTVTATITIENVGVSSAAFNDSDQNLQIALPFKKDSAADWSYDWEWLVTNIDSSESPLAANGTKTVTINIGMPADATTFQVGGHVDPGNKITEITTSDNLLAGPTMTIYPVVTDLALANTGGTVQASWTAISQVTGGYQVRYTSGGNARTENLANSARSFTFGDYMPDDNTEVSLWGDVGSGNYVKFQATTALADLTIQSVTITGDKTQGAYRVGDSYTVNAVVINQGVATASTTDASNIACDMWRNPNGSGESAWGAIWGMTASSPASSLAVNGTMTFTLGASAASAGTYTYGAFVDNTNWGAGLVPDSNRANNGNYETVNASVEVKPAVDSEGLTVTRNATTGYVEVTWTAGQLTDEAYKIEYTSGGNTISHVLTSAEISAKEFVIDSNYPDNNTKIKLISKDSSDNEYVVADKTALADVIISSITVTTDPASGVGQPYKVGETVTVAQVMKNVGIANISNNTGLNLCQKNYYRRTSSGDYTNIWYNIYSSDADKHILDVNGDTSWTWTYTITDDDLNGASSNTLYFMGKANGDANPQYTAPATESDYTNNETATSISIATAWEDATVDSGWHDVDNYAYYVNEREEAPIFSAKYTTSEGHGLSLKGLVGCGYEWFSYGHNYSVGTKKVAVDEGSAYTYNLTFARTVQSGQTIYLKETYYDSNGTELSGYPKQIDEATDVSGEKSFTGLIDVPAGAAYARVYADFRWESGNEVFHVDSNITPVLTETWTAVDEEQNLRTESYTVSDKNGGAAQYKAAQTTGTKTDPIDVRITAGQEQPWSPVVSTKFENWNLVDRKEYIATISFTSDKASDAFYITGYSGAQSIVAGTNTFTTTFIYEDGYDIKSYFGNVGKSIISNYQVTIADGAGDLNLRNTGSAVTASWTASVSGHTPTALVFTSGGVKKYVEISGDLSYTFAEGAQGDLGYPDDDTEVEVYGEDFTHTEDEQGKLVVGGTKLLRARALTDLIIESANVNHGDRAHANTNNVIYLNIKNQGTARATSSPQVVYVTAKQGTWKNYKYEFNHIILPNEVYGYVDSENTGIHIDGWRVEEIGTYQIKLAINESKVMAESDYTNNKLTITKEVTTQVEDDTAVLGFQLNYSKDSEGPSEFNPSYRTVCRASKNVEVRAGDKDSVGNTFPTSMTFDSEGEGKNCDFEYGFIYAMTDSAGLTSKNEDTLMTFAGAEGNDYIHTYQAQASVDIDSWTTKGGSTYNHDNSYFFALTLKDLYYTTKQYDTMYTFRSYLKIKYDGQTYTVYPKDIYSTSLYDIAEDLYRYKKMPTQASHDFLYDNILNIYAMKVNYDNICTEMKNALYWGGQGTTANYEMAEILSRDMYYYAMCSDRKDNVPAEGDYTSEQAGMVYLYSDKTKRVRKTSGGDPYEITGEVAGDETLIQEAVGDNTIETGYKYTHDHQFRSYRLDKQNKYSTFLNILNTDGVRYYSDTNYSSIYDWIYGEIPHDIGFYKKVKYKWDNNLDKDYGTE